jgi:hypothetical protein
MRLRHAIFVALLLVVGNTSLSVKNAIGQTRLGLHVTQEELEIWKQRMGSGPYQSQWATIKSRADGFVASPPAMWTARTTGGCWVDDSVSETRPGRTLDREMRDAGLMYLLTGSTSYRDAVRNRLLAYVAQAGTNLATNTSVWCNNEIYDSQWFEVGNWLRRLLYAYDYIRPSLGAGDVATIDAWFLSQAQRIDLFVDNRVKISVANHYNDNYTCSNFCGPNDHNQVVAFGHPFATWFADGWHNIQNTGVAFYGAVGIMLNNATLKDHAKRYFQEWIKYAIYPGGIVTDQYRWVSSGWGTTGFTYAGTAIGTMITLADHFARAGDTSLYTYSTEVGQLGSQSPGNPKSLLQVLRHLAGLTNGTILEYGSATSTSDPAKLIRPFGTVEKQIDFIDLAPASIFYNDTAINTAYRTTIPGVFSSGGYDALGGDWGSYPMILAMFGQMEGQVNPYGTTTTTPPPSSLGVTVDSTYTGYTTTPIDDGVVNATGGAATTWASAENTIDPHWITITFSSPKQLNTATIYWAYNNSRQTYMSSQQVDFQYWNGSTFQTAGSFTYTADMPSSTIIFPSVTTSQIRFHQPANKGNPQYTTVLWVTEVDYGNSTLQPPPAPSLLTLSQ